MKEKKEPLVIECSGCAARFRLWIPLKDHSEWEKGLGINCVRCGVPYLVKKNADGFAVEAAGQARVHSGTDPYSIDMNDGLTPLSHDGEGAGAGSPGPGGAATAEDSPADAEPLVPTILVVEDDALSRKMVENSLEDGTNKLIIVKNGEEAMEVLSQERIDLLVVDLYLKNPNDPSSLMDGEEVLQKASAVVNVPAIVVTGKELVDDISLDPKWFDLHVKDFIQKGNPFWVDELKVKVMDIISKR